MSNATESPAEQAMVLWQKLAEATDHGFGGYEGPTRVDLPGGKTIVIHEDYICIGGKHLYDADELVPYMDLMREAIPIARADAAAIALEIEGDDTQMIAAHECDMGVR